ncbi:MAG: hypothetical protein LBN92_01665 [Treponema sp.]|jgi:hypothetical protein|nr:hypothetical protein [Treponema sp.]
MTKRVSFFTAFLCGALVVSCIGTSTVMTVNGDGSGTVTLEYRISRGLDEMGKLDGNAGEPPLPVGRKDVERTIARVEGLRLDSYREDRTDRDYIYAFTVSFDSVEALETLMGHAGPEINGFQLEDRRITVTLPVAEENFTPLDPLSADAAELVPLLEGYDFSVTYHLPSRVSVVWKDTRGGVLDTWPGVCEVTGNSVRYTAGMQDLLLLPHQVIMEINW